MKDRPSNKWAIVILACTVLMFVPNYAQYQLSPLAHLVMPAYNLDSTQFSMLFSAAMIAGILLSLVAGLLCDRFGVKRIVGIAAIVSVAALIARIFAPDFGTLFACMALTGVVATFLNANLAKIMGSWFPPEKVGFAVGIGLAGATLSMAVGLGTSALFPSLRAIFVFTAIIAVIALAAWWLLFKDSPNQMQAEPPAEAIFQDGHAASQPETNNTGNIATSPAAIQPEAGQAGSHPALKTSFQPETEHSDGSLASSSFRQPEIEHAGNSPMSKASLQPEPNHSANAQPTLSDCLKVVLKSRNVWLIGIALGMDMAATMCIVTFLPQVLQTTRGFDPTAAGALSSVVTFGNLAGSIFAPLILARVGRFKLVAIALAVIAAAGTAFAWQLPEGPIMLVSFFLTGFTLSGLLTVMVSAIVLLPEIGPIYAGTAGGIGSTLQLFGAVVIPSYILMPILGENWPVFYGIGGILCLIAAVCALALPEILKRDSR